MHKTVFTISMFRSTVGRQSASGSAAITLGKVLYVHSVTLFALYGMYLFVFCFFLCVFFFLLLLLLFFFVLFFFFFFVFFLFSF